MKILFALLFTLICGPLRAVDANPFFAMNTIARGGPAEVVPLLKELGYAGLGGAVGDGAMATALEREGLKFFNGYLTLSCHADRPALDDHRLVSRIKHQAAGLLIVHGKQEALDLWSFEIPADGRVRLSAEAHPQRRRPGEVDLFYRKWVGEGESRKIPDRFLQDGFRQTAGLLGSGLRFQGGNQQRERLVRTLQVELGPGGVDPRAREL